MVRYADMEMAVMKKEVYTHGFLETGMACKAGPQAEVPGLVKEARGSQGNRGKSLYCGFHGKKQAKAG